MITKFVDIFMQHQEELKDFFVKHPDNYKDIVKAVISLISMYDDSYESPDPELIHEIDDGDYQGTLLYVIASKGYQPDTYWAVKVGYGSCSGCDTLEAIRDYSDDAPYEQQVKDYLTLCLHIIQGLKEI